MGAPKNRVPQKPSSKSAFDPDVKKQTEFFCCRCGKYFNRQASNFPTSKSVLYAGNNGYLPICKNCVGELYQYYLQELGSPEEAAERMCGKFDIYYDPVCFTNVIAGCAPGVAFTSYIGRLANSEHRNKSYDDYLIEKGIIEMSGVIDEEAEREAEIVSNGKMIWGYDFKADEYEYLDKEFADWNSRCNVDGKSRESMVREICVLKFLQNKALMSGDIETYNKLSTTVQKTLTTAELTPKQETDSRRATEKPMGVMIQMFENERPIPEPDPEWKDVDGVMKIILVYFIGHLCKMLGIKNKYSDMYEAEMQVQSVNVPEEIRDGDSEDVFDYLLEHGFENVSLTEEDDGSERELEDAN